MTRNQPGQLRHFDGGHGAPGEFPEEFPRSPGDFKTSYGESHTFHMGKKGRIMNHQEMYLKFIHIYHMNTFYLYLFI